jgi:hypothetical protein
MLKEAMLKRKLIFRDLIKKVDPQATKIFVQTRFFGDHINE